MGHIVRKLPVDTGRSGWEAIAKRSFPPVTLEQAETADWVIVGAGFAGLAAARRLTQRRPGDRIVMLDATRLAIGPAGRNSGYMIDVPHNVSTGGYAVGDAAQIKGEMSLNRFAIGFSREAAEEYGMPQTVFDPCGKINAAASAGGETQNSSFAKGLAQIGEAFESLGWLVREGVGERLTGSSCASLAEAIVNTGFGYAPERRRRQAEVVTGLIVQVADIRRIGAAVVDFCWLARGRMDAYFEYGLNPWDSAAGGVIASEAGVVYTGLRDDDPSGFFVGAAPGIVDDLRRALIALDADRV